MRRDFFKQRGGSGRACVNKKVLAMCRIEQEEHSDRQNNMCKGPGGQCEEVQSGTHWARQEDKGRAWSGF